MYPILIKIGWFEIHSYGVLLTISFLSGIYLAVRRGKKVGIAPNDMMNLALIIIISSLIGSRLLYVVFHLDEFRGRYLDIINPVQSTGQLGIAGLIMLGGILLATATCYLYLKYKRQSFLLYGDSVAPSLALGIFLTRIGCFLNGCCYGKTCSVPWGVVFPPDSPAGYAFYGVSIHPAQLYASLGGLIIFVLLIFLDRRSPFPGFLILWFFILYAVSRFVVDFFRYYEESMNIFSIGNYSFSLNQVICIGVLLIGSSILGFKFARKRMK